MLPTRLARARRYVACLLLVVGGAVAWSVSAAEAPPPADIVVGAALKRARSDGKTVLIEFGASWCQWCRRFEAFVKAPDTAPIVAANYVVVNLIVQERDDKKALEHPGGQMLMNRWGGETSGLPFYVFLDGTGQRIANSNAMPDGSNIGFPAAPDEIDAFMALVDQTARMLTPAQRTTLRSYLARVMPPQAAR